MLEILIENGITLSVTDVDATFAQRCLGGDKIGITKCGKGSKIMTIVNADSKPLAALVTSAKPHEFMLLEQALGDFPDTEKPKMMVGDRAYDADSHDACLQEQNIKLITPHKKNRRKKSTQDHKEIETHYKKRWCVERFFA